jgi:hypothetical protein
LRLLACLLLAAIGSDLVGDAGCDLPFSPVASVTLRAGDDAGSPVCVPDDCFCCSRATGAGPLVEAPQPGDLVKHLAPAVSERWLDGVRPVVDRPPLSRA